MAAATSLGSSGLAFEELESAVAVASYGSSGGEMLRPASTVGGFGLSTLVVSSRSGLARGGQTTAFGAEIALGLDSGEPFLLAASFQTDRASAPVAFGGVSIRVEGEQVAAYANGARMAAIKVLPGQDPQVFVVYADFGNGSRSGALVVRTSSTMSVQRAEPARVTLPRGKLAVPIESGTDAWVFYGDGSRIALDVLEIQDSFVREAATLAARECGTGSRPSSLDRSVFGLFDASIDASGPIAGTGLYSAEGYSGSGATGYGSGSGPRYGSGSGPRYGYGAGSGSGYGSGNGAVGYGQVGPMGQMGPMGPMGQMGQMGPTGGSGRPEQWPRVWSARESNF